MDNAITGAAVERYIDTAAGPSPFPLDEMEERARREAFPVIGPQVGRLLALITAISGARHILELGSGFGYSAIWFARGLAAAGAASTGATTATSATTAVTAAPATPGVDPTAGAAPGVSGLIHCTDTSPDRRDAALEYFSRAGVLDLMHFEVIDALDYRTLAARLETTAGAPPAQAGADERGSPRPRSTSSLTTSTSTPTPRSRRLPPASCTPAVCSSPITPSGTAASPTQAPPTPIPRPSAPTIALSPRPTSGKAVSFPCATA